MKLPVRPTTINSRWPEALRRSSLIAWARAAAILPRHSDPAPWVLALRPDSLAARLVDPARTEFGAASFRLDLLRELRVLRGSDARSDTDRDRL